MKTPIWTPSGELLEQSNLQDFLNSHSGKLNTKDYKGLYEWSINQPEDFWEACWHYSGIRATTNYKQVLHSGEKMLDARWFEGAYLNFADNLLRPEYDGSAIVFYSETGSREELSWKELRRNVASVANCLKQYGVGPGDRVVGLLPNRPEAVIAMLASASLGAVWSSCSPDFGTKGVLDRFGQINPKVMFATDGYFYNGKKIDCLKTVNAITTKLENLEALILVPYLDAEPNRDIPSNSVFYHDLLRESVKLEFTPLPFDHPLYIMYSSGTTGVPKCIIHGAGGTLIQHKKEHLLHCNIKPQKPVFYFTTTGWMMWNWIVSTLASGAKLILFDGSPFYPDPGVLWRIAEQEQLTLFGTSAKYLSALEKVGYIPKKQVSLSNLNILLSTGSPLAPASYDFVYQKVKEDLQLSSIAGGTELISCFAIGNPILPVYRGEIQCRGLGMKMEIFDDKGESIREHKGELVCTAPFPSMPISFWDDPDNCKYKTAYFNRYPNVWCHGDYAELTANDGVVIYGRSDAILNPGGVRIGTAEIYRVVEQFDEVIEGIAIAQEWDNDIRVVLFIKLIEGTQLDQKLEKRLKKSIRDQASPRHVPAKIIEVPDIPRTRSGKIVEIAVRDVVHGKSILNTEAIANPEALEYFRNRSELGE